MCYTATLPSVIKAENFNSDLFSLTRIFNRWLKMLKNYGKLDDTSLQDDFTVIAKVVKSHETKKDIRRAAKRCRDYALAETMRIADLVRYLTAALKCLCNAQESKEVRKIKKAYADQGMTEKYRPLSKRLAKEKIRKIGREVIYTDYHTDDSHDWCAALSKNVLHKKPTRMQVNMTVKPIGIAIPCKEPYRSISITKGIRNMMPSFGLQVLTGK